MGPCPLSLDTYLELVDETGRLVRSGKRGVIPAHLAPIGERLEIDAAAWVDVMMHGGGAFSARASDRPLPGQGRRCGEA